MEEDQTTEQSDHTKSSKTTNTRILILFLFVLAALLIASGISYKLNAQKQQTTLQQKAVVSTQTISPTPDPTASWKTYYNPNGLYAIKYPATFTYEEIINTHGVCKKQFLLLDDKQRNVAEGDEDNIVGNIVIDVCSIGKPISNEASLYVEEEKPASTMIDGSPGFAAQGITDFSGIGYRLGYEFHVDRRVVYRNGLEYFIDFRYTLPRSGKLPMDYQTTFGLFNQILSTFKFTEQTSTVGIVCAGPVLTSCPPNYKCQVKAVNSGESNKEESGTCVKQ